MEHTARSTEHFSRGEERRAKLGNSLRSALADRSRITLEIGSGHGHFLTGYAAAHPNRFCVGIDMILDRLQRSERKRTRAALPNLMFLRAEAGEFLDALPENVRLDDVFVLFPDPWPKRRHHKNRLLQASFLDSLAAHTISGARLCFRSDYTEYFSASLATVGKHPDWIIAAQPWPYELATVFQARADSYRSWIAVKK